MIMRVSTRARRAEVGRIALERSAGTFALIESREFRRCRAERPAILAANGIGCDRMSLRCASISRTVTSNGRNIRGCRFQARNHKMRRDLIFDIGLHYGEDSELYLKKGFSVVAVEANPIIAAQAAKRLQEYLRTGQLTIVNKAIAGDEGPIIFFACENVAGWGTTDITWVERNRRFGASIKEMSVDGIRFSSLIKEYGIPYYMKVDIEGADTLCLEGLLESHERPKFISIESCKTSFDDLLNEFCLFQKLGFRNYKIIAQHKIAKQRLPYPPQEGKFVDHSFEYGSSGAFGLELPGEWISLESVLKAYMGIFKRYRLTGDSGSLRGIGAVRNALNAEKSQQPSAIAVMAGRILRNVGSKLNLKAGWYDTHAILDERPER
jgi:FkbM family methyltransferase